MDTTRVKIIIEDVLNLLTVQYERVEIERDDVRDQPKFVVRSTDSRLLIGNGGEHLRALNTLVRQIVRKNDQAGELQFYIDVNSYYSRHFRELADAAKRLAERAKFFKRDVEMAPAPAHDRLVIHSCLSEDPEIETESHGEGRFRRVVVKYRARTSSPFGSDEGLGI